MVKLHELTKKTRLPTADYTLEKLDDLEKVLKVITPRIEGRWSIVIVGLNLNEARKLIEVLKIPDWVDIKCYISGKRIEMLSLTHPEVLPKHETFAEQVESVVASLNVMIETKALNKLKSAYWNNINDFTDMCHLLETKVTDTIRLADIDKYVNYAKPVYASEVVNMFLTHDRRRWKKFYTLLTELGESYAYNAMYKYVKNLIVEKRNYLQGEDAKYRILETVDGFTISYAYSVFAMSTNYKQLYGILYSIDNRCTESLERTLYDYL